MITAKIAMTAPVLTQNNRMTFILPSAFKSLQDLPRPNTRQVELSSVPNLTVAALQFSGATSDEVVAEQERRLREYISQDEKIRFREDASVFLARYNAPWTIPFYRTNEVMLQVDLLE